MTDLDAAQGPTLALCVIGDGEARAHGEDDPAISGWTWPGRG